MQNRANVDRLLADSFKELADKMPIDKITIKEITDRAGVIRPTFYNHFQDKYALLEWIIRTEILDPVIPLIQNGQLRDGLLMIFSNLRKEKEFYVKVARLEGQYSCESITRKLIREILFAFVNEQAGGRREVREGLTVGLVAEYYAQSIAFLIISWIRMDMNLTAEKMADLFHYITRHSMEEVIEEMQGKA